MSYSQLRRYKYLLILMLIFLSALFFNYIFVYAAFSTNSESGFNINYVGVPEIDFTASAINTKLKSVSNLTEIIFDYDDGTNYETIQENGTFFTAFAGQDHISSYAVATETETKIYILSETDIYAPTNCGSMFSGLTSLKSVTFNNFDTSAVTSMQSMFYRCTNLVEVKGGINCQSATNLVCMFYDCSNLTTIDKFGAIGSSDILTNLNSMFYNCKKLTSVDADSVGRASDAGGMFSGCTAITSIGKFNEMDFSEVTYFYMMFYCCSSLESLDNFTSVGYIGDGNAANMECMFFACTSLTSVDVQNVGKASGTCQMFYGCSSLETIKNFNKLDISNVTSMSGMFYNCQALTELDLSSFDTSNVKDMSDMFYGCSSLTSLDLSNFNTSNVTSMYAMFSGCSSLTSLDLSSFNTGNVTSMYAMFSKCSSLTSITWPTEFKTGEEANMSSMFYYCSSLESLDLSSFNTSNVTTMKWMFYYCKSLTSLDLSSFNTSKVESMIHMFSGCSSLTSLDLSSFNTEKVEDMSSMFSDCTALTSLDLSSFNTSNVTDMSKMFWQCPNLKTIYVSSLWSTDAVTSSTYMFSSCTKLVGGAGTTFNSSYKDKTYARIDGGTANPGYLTQK